MPEARLAAPTDWAMQTPGRPDTRAYPSAMYATAFSEWPRMRLMPTSSISASARRRIASMKNTCVTPYAFSIRANSRAPFIFSAIGFPYVDYTLSGESLCYQGLPAMELQIECEDAYGFRVQRSHYVYAMKSA